MTHTNSTTIRHVFGRTLLPPGCPHSPVCSLFCLCSNPLPRRVERRRALRPPHVVSVSVAPSVLPPGQQMRGGEHLSLLPPAQGCDCGAPPGRDPALGHHSPPFLGEGPPSSGRLAIAAVSELAVLSNLQFGGVGGGDAVTGLHAVPLFQLRQGTHEAGIGSVQGGDALLLWARRVSVGHKMGSRMQGRSCWARDLPGAADAYKKQGRRTRTHSCQVRGKGPGCGAAGAMRRGSASS